MSRVAKNPVIIPAGVNIDVIAQSVTVKGPKGSLSHDIHRNVKMTREEQMLKFEPKGGTNWAQAGTARAIINNLVQGVSNGFEKKLALVGVGYRAQAQGKSLNLTLGFSHPVDYQLPEGITAETPSQTEIVIKGIDKQQVGQAAAEIRSFRPPEPYKGKGVRYADEEVVMKEAKKK